MKPNTKI